FDQIESIKKSTERIPELLKNFRQQILTYAVTGKLTEDYCNSLCYMDLQEIILQLKEQRINQLFIKSAKDKLEKIYSDDNSSLDFPIPKQWIPVNIDKVCDSFTYGTSAKSENEGKYPVIRMGNIQNGKLDWSDLKYTSDESEYMKYKLNIGDILFNRTNSPELVGKTTIYDGNRAACYAGYIIKIDPYRKYVNPYYLNIVLNSQYAKRWCWENKTDGVSQSNINAQKISKFTIPYPSLSEQEEIVNRIQSLFTKLDIVEKRYAALCDILNKLPQAILNKAFKGKLV
ncbi:MAG: restriction endonuclease subunit S, partial [Alphaproteobacteria bacterium]|nr:restriction endonuclease subunit S [Alphaproteobacteria bacterium]